MTACPFCEYAGPSVVLEHYPEAYVIKPLDPVTPGHVLVVSYLHHEVADIGDHELVGELAAAAARFITEHGLGDCNLVMNLGPAATQTVDHLHLHVVPRRPGDGLRLPWGEG